MGKMIDLTGKVFGRLTVLEPTDQRRGSAVVWKCKCICGNEVYVARHNLLQATTLSCGCLKSENITKINKESTKDITGKKYGRLTAIEPTEKRFREYVIWKCKCSCGKEALVSLRNLTNGTTLSCGCLASELASKKSAERFADFRENNYIAGTRLDTITNTKLNKNNTTGYKGVYLRKKDDKYVSYIKFQGKRYFLGGHDTKELAYEARKEAEDKLYGDFLKWYNEIYKKEEGNTDGLEQIGKS